MIFIFIFHLSFLFFIKAKIKNIRYKTKDGNKFVHTLNNTVLATPRALIALIECNYNEDGSITVPKVLQPYMGGLEVLVPKNK